MSFPAFYSDVPTITLRDSLADFLGAAEGGILRYTYSDAVHLAGHSCGVVATAWLMARAGLAALYGDGLPERGGVEVHLRDAQKHGTIGVTAAVLGLVTGAAGPGGFHGIGATHRFARRDLMVFDAGIEAPVALRRSDTGAGVLIEGNHQVVPMDDELKGLFARAVSGEAAPDEQIRFAILWQDRVRSLLLEHANDVVSVRDWA